MPCVLFTFHGHGTWLPDHPRGYVHRQHGPDPSDPNMAAHYRFQQRGEAVLFTESHQSEMFKLARQAIGTGDGESPLQARLHACAAEPTHLHVLASWNDETRAIASMRRSIRTALSRGLNQSSGRRDWFSDGSANAQGDDCKRVRDIDHFDHLVLEYLPGHHKSWVRESDTIAATRRQQMRDRGA